MCVPKGNRRENLATLIGAWFLAWIFHCKTAKLRGPWNCWQITSHMEYQQTKLSSLGVLTGEYWRNGWDRKNHEQKHLRLRGFWIQMVNNKLRCMVKWCTSKIVKEVSKASFSQMWLLKRVLAGINSLGTLGNKPVSTLNDFPVMHQNARLWNKKKTYAKAITPLTNKWVKPHQNSTKISIASAQFVVAMHYHSFVAAAPADARPAPK